MEPPTSTQAQRARAQRERRAGHVRGCATWAREGRRGRDERARAAEVGANVAGRLSEQLGPLRAREGGSEARARTSRPDLDHLAHR